MVAGANHPETVARTLRPQAVPGTDLQALVAGACHLEREAVYPQALMVDLKASKGAYVVEGVVEPVCQEVVEGAIC